MLDVLVALAPPKAPTVPFPPPPPPPCVPVGDAPPSSADAGAPFVSTKSMRPSTSTVEFARTTSGICPLTSSTPSAAITNDFVRTTRTCRPPARLTIVSASLPGMSPVMAFVLVTRVVVPVPIRQSLVSPLASSMHGSTVWIGRQPHVIIVASALASATIAGASGGWVWPALPA